MSEHVAAVTRSLTHYKFACPEFFYPANEFFNRCLSLFDKHDIRLLDISFDSPSDILKTHLTAVIKNLSQTPKWSKQVIPLFCLIAEMSDVSHAAVIPRKTTVSTLTTKQRRKGAPMPHDRTYKRARSST